MIEKYKYLRKTLRIFRSLLLTFAGFCLFLLIFSFTTGPFWIYYWLGTGNSEMTGKPEAIVLLGGGGMPSKSSLLRTYHTSVLHEAFPESIVYIALPGDTADTSSSIYAMRSELMLRGIPEEKILFEPDGRNTRAQALNILESDTSLAGKRIVMVTSPEHMYRSILTFRKAGFNMAEGFPAFERAIEADILFEDDDLGGRKMVPDVGQSIQLRYQFWNHLKYEIMIVREFMAMGYYKLKGWI